MSKPLVIKGALKLKSSQPVPSKKTTVQLPPKVQAGREPSPEKKEEPLKGTQEQEDGKTPAERAFQIAKKSRLIHKYSQRSQLSIKERMEKRNRILSKLPDHEDLFKTGQKIQKGY